MSRRGTQGIPLAAAIKQVAYYDNVDKPSQTITAVNTAHTIIIPSIRIGATTSADGLVYMALTDSTTITITGGAATANVWVLEFLPGVIKSIQRFVATNTSGTSTTQAITSVNTGKSIIICTGYNGTSVLSTNDVMPRIEFNSATEVGITHASLGGSTINVAFQVIEFYGG